MHTHIHRKTGKERRRRVANFTHPLSFVVRVTVFVGSPEQKKETFTRKKKKESKKGKKARKKRTSKRKTSKK